MRGITPVIAIVLILIISVAVTGMGYMFISGYVSSIGSGAIQVSSSCSSGAVNIYIKNIGDNPIPIMPRYQQIAEYTTDANTVLLLHFDGDYWDEAQGKDRTGVGGDPTFGAGAPNLGQGLQFDGTLDRISYGLHGTYNNFPAGMTIEAWIYPEQYTTPNNYILCKIRSGGDHWCLLRDETNNSLAFETTGINPPNAEAASPSLNEWHHVAAVLWPGSHKEIYIDGVLVSTTPVTGGWQNVGGNLFIGDKNNTVGPGNWIGWIDEVRVMNIPINFSEPQANFASGCNGGNCGGIIVTRSDGGGTFTFSGSRTELAPKETAILTDTCGSERCKYSLTAGLVQMTTTAAC